VTGPLQQVADAAAFQLEDAFRFAALQQLGGRTLYSRTRSDRPDWIASLKANYGAVERGTLRGGAMTQLEFPLDLTRFTGWPARRTLGAGWMWSGGRVTLREIPEKDYATLLPEIARLWGASHPRLPLARRIFEEWTVLDRAAVLLGAVDGALTDVRVIRPRRAGVSSNAVATPYRETADQGTLARGVAQWCRDAGYTTATSLAPAWMAQNLTFEKHMARVGATRGAPHDRLREPMVEYQQDLAAALARPVNAWTA